MHVYFSYVCRCFEVEELSFDISNFIVMHILNVHMLKIELLIVWVILLLFMNSWLNIDYKYTVDFILKVRKFNDLIPISY